MGEECVLNGSEVTVKQVVKGKDRTIAVVQTKGGSPVQVDAGQQWRWCPRPGDAQAGTDGLVQTPSTGVRIVVLDFEATCVRTGRPEPQEIIELLMIELHRDNLDTIGEFEFRSAGAFPGAV